MIVQNELENVKVVGGEKETDFERKKRMPGKTMFYLYTAVRQRTPCCGVLIFLVFFFFF